MILSRSLSLSCKDETAVVGIQQKSDGRTVTMLDADKLGWNQNR